MLGSYEDIRSRIAEEPKWFDENGVPRYATFTPDLSPNIYADEVVLFEIMCQCCGREYRVERNWRRGRNSDESNSISDLIRRKALRYGDPPCFGHADCAAGATMTAINIRTIEFWERRNPQREWKRNPELEGAELEGEYCKGCGELNELCDCEEPEQDDDEDA